MNPEDNFEFGPLPSDDFEVSQFLAGLLAGAAIGAGLALLFAPKPGEEARRDVASAYASVADCAAEAVDTVRDRVAASLVEVREKTAEVVEEARSTVEEWISKSKQTILETRERLDGAVDAGREAYESRRAELDAQLESSPED
ncbi:MAG TPA: YtxH domain-containing protein [Armatimonadota bacterium]|jgi:gas vesicle protein